MKLPCYNRAAADIPNHRLIKDLFFVHVLLGIISGAMNCRGHTADHWKREHARLWKATVPAQGQAATLQGELIRITGKLTDQAYRNGNCN
jgi:hypothetical protein